MCEVGHGYIGEQIYKEVHSKCACLTWPLWQSEEKKKSQIRQTT